jgi:glycosyltransferase involved in cell wall biosynthesis
MQVRAKGGTLMSGPTEVIMRMVAQGAVPAKLRAKHVVPRQDLGRRARVLAVVHGWMPSLAAGSERMLQHMLDALPRDEFEISVLSLGIGDDYPVKQYEYQGLPVHVGYAPPFEPDIIITHHGPGARVTQAISQDYPNARVVAVYHNERYDIPDIQALSAELEVFNTHWVVARILRPGATGWDGLTPGKMVVHPPLEFERHTVDETGSAVTLVNLQENKGVHVFQELARRMPDVRFLGVEGTHGLQEKPRIPNIEYMAVTQDMRDVWRKSRVVLMPSGYESYGMVAAEAQVNGIPVIANPTPGLGECLGHAGIFIPRANIDDYERTLRLLLEDRTHYQERSEMARLRGLELEAQTKRELARFVDEMRNLA